MTRQFPKVQVKGPLLPEPPLQGLCRSPHGAGPWGGHAAHPVLLHHRDEWLRPLVLTGLDDGCSSPWKHLVLSFLLHQEFCWDCHYLLKCLTLQRLSLAGLIF